MKRVLLVLAAMALGVGAILVYQGSRSVAVRVVTVERGAVRESLDEDGLVKSAVEVDLAPRVQAHLLRLAVRNGQRVRRGDLIAELDSRDLTAALAAARANELTARSQWAEAQARRTVEAGILASDLESSRASESAARANYLKVVRGSRTQELRSAEAQLTSAEAARREARANLRRVQELFDHGFVSAQQLDAARTSWAVADSSWEQARQRLSLLREGPLREDREVAQRELDRAAA
ncbi:MAG: biotin/lipoyl-binding protein, partial [Candidatus Eremiobacterota bacterium]